MVVADISVEHAENTLDNLGSVGDSSLQHTCQQLDVTSVEHVANMMKLIKKDYQRYPCISVHCHGITRDDFIVKMSEERFNEVINVNQKVQ